MERPQPEFFHEDNVEMVNFQIGQLGIDYSAALEVVEMYRRQNDPEAKAGMVKEALEDPEVNKLYGDIGAIVGQSFMSAFVDDMVISDMRPLDEKQVSIEDYVDSGVAIERCATDLADLACYLQEHGRDQIIKHGFCEDDNEAERMAWKGVWSRVVSTMRPIGGVVLADVADMFDRLVQCQYPQTYDPVDPDRGREARADVSASTFYEVFAPHLNRAITRSGEDGWTGH